MKRLLAVFALLLVPLCLASAPAAAREERILDFQSLVSVDPGGDVLVRETITVFAAGQQIKRGIYRDFPTRYRDRLGNRVTVGFEVLEVLRDGETEAYHTQSINNGVRVYVGSSDRYLEPGEYVYTLAYRTNRQVGFFEGFDELYWNVTGNEWAFTIERASAEIRIPPGAQVLEYAAYTGPTGATGTDYEASTEGGVLVRFATTRPLAPKEGLTVAVSWPKGFVAEPSPREKAWGLLTDNPTVSISLAGLLLVLAYFIAAWLMVGRDLPRGVIFPHFTPPQELSPAGMRYLMKMGYSDRVFAAAVINMAVKGYLTIEEKEKIFTLRRAAGDESALSPSEREIAATIFGGSRSVELKNTNHRQIGGAVEALKKNLRTELDTSHFVTNRRWLLPGVALTVLTLVALMFRGQEGAPALFMTVWLGGWTFACYALILNVARSWRAGAGKGFAALLFSIPFFAGEIVGIILFSFAISLAGALFLVLIIAVNALFFHLLKAPTLKGRRLMDQVEGFKMFLEAAEQDRMERLHPPEKTRELFEKYLPYALALDVENSWCEKFNDVLAASATGGEEYRPTWYSGGHPGSFSPGAMASSLGSSFSSALSSSSSPPGSRSGSGGGGSSGGGGGGGGGGGW